MASSSSEKPNKSNWSSLDFLAGAFLMGSEFQKYCHCYQFRHILFQNQKVYQTALSFDGILIPETMHLFSLHQV